MSERYTGLVRALGPCVVGAYRSTGDVFEVTDMQLWSDDPFEPVTQTTCVVSGFEQLTYTRAQVSASDASTRPRGEEK